MCCLHELWFEFQELEAIKARVREMEEEDKRLKELQLEAESCLLMGSEAGTGCPWVLLCSPGSWGVSGAGVCCCAPVGSPTPAGTRHLMWRRERVPGTVWCCHMSYPPPTFAS